MDAERFTESALQAVGLAQQVAQSRNHQPFGPLYLAIALLRDKDSPSSRVVNRAGGDLEGIRSNITAQLDKLPKVSGEAVTGQYLEPKLARAFERAQELADRWSDSSIAADALLVASGQEAGEELS